MNTWRRAGIGIGVVLLLVAVALLAGCRRNRDASMDWGARRAVGSKVEVPAFAPVAAASVAHARHGDKCNVDSIDGQTAQGMALDHLGVAAFWGWVADPDTGTVPASVDLLLLGDQDFSVAGQTGRARPDVAASLKTPAFANAGFGAAGALYRVPIGDYELAVAFRSRGEQVVCETSVRVSVQ